MLASPSKACKSCRPLLWTCLTASWWRPPGCAASPTKLPCPAARSRLQVGSCLIHASIPASYLLHTCLIPPSYRPRTGLIHAFLHASIHASILASYLLHTCPIQAFVHAFIQASYRPHTCVIPASYLPHTCVIPASYVRHTCCKYAFVHASIHASYLLDTGLSYTPSYTPHTGCHTCLHTCLIPASYMPSYIHLPRERLLSCHRGLAMSWADEVQSNFNLGCFLSGHRLQLAVLQV